MSKRTRSSESIRAYREVVDDVAENALPLARSLHDRIDRVRRRVDARSEPSDERAEAESDTSVDVVFPYPAEG